MCAVHISITTGHSRPIRFAVLTWQYYKQGSRCAQQCASRKKETFLNSISGGESANKMQVKRIKDYG